MTCNCTELCCRKAEKAESFRSFEALGELSGMLTYRLST